jgi:OmpA-OmpF porin, OOP family
MKVKELQLIALTYFLISGAIKVNAQSNNPWTIGLGTNIISDNGLRSKGLFKVSESWMVVPFPSRISLERELGLDFSLEVVSSVNSFKPGKLGSSFLSTTPRDYMSLDFLVKFKLDDIIGRISPYFSPYMFGGFGFYSLGSSTVQSLNGNQFVQPLIQTSTLNLGIGWNTWISPALGINFQSVGKFVGNKPDLSTPASNHIQHSVGLIYRYTGNERFLRDRSRYKRISPSTSIKKRRLNK